MNLTVPIWPTHFFADDNFANAIFCPTKFGLRVVDSKFFKRCPEFEKSREIPQRLWKSSIQQTNIQNCPTKTGKYGKTGKLKNNYFYMASMYATH